MRIYRCIFALVFLVLITRIGYSQKRLSDAIDFDVDVSGHMEPWSKFIGGGIVKAPWVWSGSASVAIDGGPVHERQGWALRDSNGVTIIVLGDPESALELINKKDGKFIQVILSKIISPKGKTAEEVFWFDALKEQSISPPPLKTPPSNK